MKRREIKQLLKNLPRYYGIKTYILIETFTEIEHMLKNLPRYYGIKTKLYQLACHPLGIVKEPAQILWD